MNGILDLDTIYRQEKSRWMKTEAPRKGFREYVAESVPYWIAIVAVVLFGLSAPHTAEVFNKLTPGLGWIAPIGVEFGLLYSAFRRRLAVSANERIPRTLWMLEVLLFVTAMLVNGAGAFTSVVKSSGIEALSFAAILERFGSLPATTQAALIMAVLSAFIIPIGTLVAGEGLAALVLEHRSANDFREVRWAEVEFTVIYRAVYVRYMQQGLPDKEAKQRAMSEVKGYLTSTGNVSAVRLLSVSNGQSERTAQDNGNSVKAKVKAYLMEHPEVVDMSISRALSVIREAGIQAGRTTVAEVLQEHRSNAVLA